MKDRQLTFTDRDENPLTVRLKQDRIELSVVDSHPELEAGELRGFIAALYAEYLGPALVQRITAARARLEAARGKRGRAAEDALERAVSALDDVLEVMTDAGAIDAADLPAGERPRRRTPSYAPVKLPKPPRAEDGGVRLGWGWLATGG